MEVGLLDDACMASIWLMQLPASQMCAVQLWLVVWQLAAAVVCGFGSCPVAV